MSHDKLFDARAAFEEMFERFLRARWLLDFSFSEATGFHLNWTEHGALSALRLNRWNRALRITEGDDRAGILDRLARAGNLVLGSDPAATSDYLSLLVVAGFATHVEFLPVERR